ncbi:MAG: hypothetical protein KDC90_11385, partial [Ignavibacteriae bacterium]|nr:hypothetical protein [Ignavibacteriota bacterium]
MKKVFLIFLVLFFNSAELYSQIKIHKTIATGDGLVNGQARDIFEDSKGYIWFATNGGVSRWDGETFLNFTERTGLTSAYIFDIAEAPDGTIYFANFGVNGINTFKDGKLDTLFNEGENKLTFLTIIHFTKDSSLIMGAADGIYLFKNN